MWLHTLVVVHKFRRECWSNLCECRGRLLPGQRACSLDGLMMEKETSELMGSIKWDAVEGERDAG